jgi:glyoxylase-like metal-dependent hydrolase (beta-lactamase superfamily II)
MQIEKYVLGPIATNAYLLYDESSKCGLVFDPGMNPANLVDRIKQLSLTIEAIILTHTHSLNGSENFAGSDPMIFAPAEIEVQGGQTLSFFGKEFQVLFTPGHSPGSISLYDGEVVYAGDALFKGAIGRTDLRDGDYQTLIDAIQRQLFTLPDNTIVHPGHGPSTTIGHERKTNPFFS